MRVDIVSIFPAYLEPLRLSLVGKAVDAGLIDLRVHDLRDKVPHGPPTRHPMVISFWVDCY